MFYIFTNKSYSQLLASSEMQRYLGGIEMNKKLRSIIKKENPLYKIIHKCYNALKLILYYIIKLLFKIENKAVFCSFNGKSYSCNPRAISEELHKQSPDTKIVWAFLDVRKKRNVVPDYVRCVKHGSIRELYD